ncbi:MAG: hypothetical protein MUO60_13115 [Clostridiaceae bacterium]|nr:hypothetical protein [Clostridiaceae bacterium]
MKKILTIILPSLLIFAFICIDHFMFSIDSMNVIVYIYLVFPIIFIVQGIVCSKSRNSLIIGDLLSSIAIFLPFSIWYNWADLTPAVVIYLLLGVI